MRILLLTLALSLAAQAAPVKTSAPQPIVPAPQEQIFQLDPTLRAFSNIFLGNLEGEPPGGFSASDLADFPEEVPAELPDIRWEGDW